VKGLLAGNGVASAIAGRTLVQLTTIGPQTAREGQRWAQAHGGRFLAGALQAAPGQMGRPDTPILVSGQEDAWNAERDVLNVLGGGIIYLGPDPAAAPTMDLATLSWVYGAMLGFVQGAVLAEGERVDVAAYGRIVRQIAPSFGAFFEHEGKVIQSKDFTASESPLRISVDATARLLSVAQAMGVDTQLPALAADLFARAARAGLGDQEAAAIIKLLRR
jgi:3-hydroxyisobutyrate dehydrogenase-like beta-hydroxyacid dehydrogenase